MKCANSNCSSGVVSHPAQRNAYGEIVVPAWDSICANCNGTGSQPELAGQESMFDA